MMPIRMISIARFQLKMWCDTRRGIGHYRVAMRRCSHCGILPGSHTEGMNETRGGVDSLGASAAVCRWVIGVACPHHGWPSWPMGSNQDPSASGCRVDSGRNAAHVHDLSNISPPDESRGSPGST
jgi:hypothetical protein